MQSGGVPARVAQEGQAEAVFVEADIDAARLLLLSVRYDRSTTQKEMFVRHLRLLAPPCNRIQRASY